MNSLTRRADGVTDEVRVFLHESSGTMSAIELQKKIFFAELFITEQRAGRLTKAHFKPMMYGAYSDEIRTAIDCIEDEKALLKRSRVRNGKSENVFTYLEPSDKMADKKVQYIDSVLGIIDRVGLNVEDLTELSKRPYPIKNEGDQEYISFSEYRREIKDGTRNPEIGVYTPEADLDVLSWTYDLEK